MINLLGELNEGFTGEEIALKHKTELKALLTFMAANAFSVNDINGLISLLDFIPVTELL